MIMQYFVETYYPANFTYPRNRGSLFDRPASCWVSRVAGSPQSTDPHQKGLTRGIGTSAGWRRVRDGPTVPECWPGCAEGRVPRWLPSRVTNS